MTIIRLVMTVLLSGLFLSCSNSFAQSFYTEVDLKSKNIEVLGANYVFRENSKLSYYRFSEATLSAPMSDAMFNANKARTNSGIRLRFASASPKFRLTFAPEQGENRGSEFAILQNNRQTHTFTFNGNQSKGEMVLEFNNESDDKEVEYMVVLPSFANVALQRFEQVKGYDLLSLKKDERPIYLALGNSITHGVGQGSAAYLSYPYLLAKQLDYNYYNLAVGGAKISPAIAHMTGEMPQADLITILIGYNDWQSNNKTVEQYINAYSSYLAEIRKNQPSAKIYCITLTHTRAYVNENTGVKSDEFRIALSHLVKSFQKNGDTLLYLIEGDKISSEVNLRADLLTDKVHFSVEGAALFADELYKIIRPNPGQ